MDWEPSPGAALSNGGWTRRPPTSWDDEDADAQPATNDWDSFATNKQRMFGLPQQDETGLESLLAGWGLGGGGLSDTTSSLAAPSTGAGRRGLVLDEVFLRAVGLSLVAVRCVGAVAGHLITTSGSGSAETVGILLTSSNRPLLGFETGTTCLSLLLLATGSYDSQPSKLLYGAIDALAISARCIALFFPTLRDASGIQVMRDRSWTPAMGWAAWAALDLLTLVRRE